MGRHNVLRSHIQVVVVALLAACTTLVPMHATRAQGTRAAAGASSVRTALQHATLAAAATELAPTREHLRHVLNCLEGKDGSDYNASAGDPCNGNGALSAFPSGTANRVRVTKAIRLLTVGVTFHDFKPAHYVALAVQAALQEIGT